MSEQKESECRICLTSDVNVFKPCPCAWVHQECLNQWRRTSHRATWECDICHFKYRFGNQLWSVKILKSQITHTILTLLLITSVVAFVCYFIKYFALLVLGLQRITIGKLVWWAILLIGFITFILAFLADDRDRHINFTWWDYYMFHNSPQWLDYFSYAFGIGGFGIFMKLTYFIVREKIMQKCEELGEQILSYH
jgi:magnesium-transporting ATPase (P-type)